MLDYSFKENTWEPKRVDWEESNELWKTIRNLREKKSCLDKDYFIVIYFFPDIIGYFIYLDSEGTVLKNTRFVFHKGYIWHPKQEELFDEFVLNDQGIVLGPFDSIYDFYSKAYPEWHLQRYYTKPIKLLDHIYHCMRKNTVKELLYKAGLDELARYRNTIEDVNLLVSSPKKVFDGISMRMLRLLNSKGGADLISGFENRKATLRLLQKNNWLLECELNHYQCCYLKFLIDEKYNDEDIRTMLKGIGNIAFFFCDNQYSMFRDKQKRIMEIRQEYPVFERRSSLYVPYLKETENNIKTLIERYNCLKYYLIEQYDKACHLLQKSNGNRNFGLEERYEDFRIAFPKSIDEFCETGVYMRNCLMCYIGNHVYNDCDILFLYKGESKYPYIAMRIEAGEMIEFKYRFNKYLNQEDLFMLKAYCKRHGLGYLAIDEELEKI